MSVCTEVMGQVVCVFFGGGGTAKSMWVLLNSHQHINTQSADSWFRAEPQNRDQRSVLHTAAFLAVTAFSASAVCTTIIHLVFFVYI